MTKFHTANYLVFPHCCQALRRQVILFKEYSSTPVGLFFCQTERRAREPLHHGSDFLKAARGACEGIETLEADQSVEDVNHLIEGLRGWPPIFFNEAPDDDTKASPPPFVPCPHHLLEVRIECSQSPESTRHK